MSRRRIALALALAMPWSAQAIATELSIAIKPEFSTGKYGTDTRTRQWVTPLDVKLRQGGHGIGLRIPYIVENGNQDIVPGLGPVGSANADTFHRRGLGNVRVSAWTRFWEDPDTGATLGAAIRVAPPAIRRLQSLGVDFTRVSLELEASVPLPQHFAMDLTLGRRMVIGAPGSGLHDFWYGTVDVSRSLSDTWSVGLTIDTQGPSSSTGTAILEIGPWVEYAIAPGWRVGAYLYRGFTRDSADWGAGFTVTRRFAI